MQYRLIRSSAAQNHTYTCRTGSTTKTQTRPGAVQKTQTGTQRYSTGRQAHTGTAQALVWTDTSRCSTKDADRDTEVQHKPLYRQTRPDEAQAAAVKGNADLAKISAGIF
jgi:hypothetical protein